MGNVPAHALAAAAACQCARCSCACAVLAAGTHVQCAVQQDQRPALAAILLAWQGGRASGATSKVRARAALAHGAASACSAHRVVKTGTHATRSTPPAPGPPLPRPGGCRLLALLDWCSRATRNQHSHSSVLLAPLGGIARPCLLVLRRCRRRHLALCNHGLQANTQMRGVHSSQAACWASSRATSFTCKPFVL